MKTKYILLTLIICMAQWSYGQLTFPKGKVLDLHTSTDYLYNETGVFFHTGKNRVTDYNWVKDIWDSLDNRWDLQACMNGDCKVGLPEQGPFIRDFGINDTTGFIKFHVITNSKSGVSKLKYWVSHKTDTADHALMEFNIYYTKSTGLAQLNPHEMMQVFPNPANGLLKVNNLTTAPAALFLFSVDGRMVKQLPAESGVSTIDVSDLDRGIYLLQMKWNDRTAQQSIYITR